MTMDAVAVAILALIALAGLGLVALARRRAWNADGSDDARRRGPDDPAPPSDGQAR
ncbi:MAG TPA: hypothetical protein VM327_05475 [Candidatus Thermoplasmatota archaeon]|nr:hypothetical protein [Candidatus Thermoplasmatota archaeon]